MGKGKRVTAKIEGGAELVRRLEKMGLDVRQVVEAAAQAGAQVIADAANGLAPAPRVLVEADAKARKPGRVTMSVGPDKEKWYWMFLETGATEHPITPRRKKALAFDVDGERVMAWAVKHPGMAARPFLRPAFDAEQANAKDMVGEHIKQVTR